MSNKNILNLVDHTALGAITVWSDIEKLCEEAVQYHTASVCIPPSYVKRVSDKYGSQLVVCTVIGFPLGYNTKETKIFEAQEAVRNGAEEIDMVVNLGDIKDKEFDVVADEVKSIKEAVGNRILKVIIETCYLTDEEKIRLCGIVTEAGADFIKTSTGFGTAGANMADIELFRKYVGEKVHIKASGGIRTKEQIEAFVKAGADRIGASSAVRAYT